MSHRWNSSLCPILPANLTKMFHVKPFGPVGTKNLTRPHTPAALRCVGWRGKLLF
jgi:hypothetical protein